MDAISGGVAILAALVPFIIWLCKRHAAKEDSPIIQNQNRYATIDADIASGNSVKASLHATADLDYLDRLLISEGNKPGPAGGTPQTRTGGSV